MRSFGKEGSLGVVKEGDGMCRFMGICWISPHGAWRYQKRDPV